MRFPKKLSMEFSSSLLIVFIVLVASTTSEVSATKMNLIHRSGYGKHSIVGTVQDTRADIIHPEYGQLVFVNISVGNPPRPQLLAMDTGSDLTWIQCVGCQDCFWQDRPYFDPAGSSSFRNHSCDYYYCDNECEEDEKTCTYRREYQDDNISGGALVADQFTFSTSDEGLASFSNIDFGCRYRGACPGMGGATGLLGLSRGDLGLPYQLKAERFSHCIGEVANPNYIHSHLILGEGSRLEGPSTPLYRNFGDDYTVSLEGISVGNQRLDITPSVVPALTERVTLDTGSTLTFLPSVAVDAIRNEVEKFVGTRLKRVWWMDDTILSYYGVATRDMIGFPKLRLHLAGGVDLELGIQALFKQASQQFLSSTFFYLTFTAGKKEKETTGPVIGLSALQFYNVGYDLTKHRVHFLKIDCEDLEE